MSTVKTESLVGAVKIAKGQWHPIKKREYEDGSVETFTDKRISFLTKKECVDNYRDYYKKNRCTPR